MYSQQINRQSRGAFIVMVDCSASMRAMTRFNNTEMPKAEVVALMCNLIIDELIERATRHHVVRNYYDIAVIGYQHNSIFSLLAEPLGEGFSNVELLSKFAPSYEIFNLKQQLDNGLEINIPFSYRPWITPRASGKTPMYEAFITVRDMIAEWCSRPENRRNFPPIVINITDGECNDATPEELVAIAQDIDKCATEDGHTLLINVHLSALDGDTCRRLFPSERRFTTESNYCKMLFDMSSSIPPCLEPLIDEIIQLEGRGPYRAMAFNASPMELFAVMNIGSESVRSNFRIEKE